MNSCSHSDNILPPDLQDVLVIPLSDPGVFQSPTGTCQTNWNDNYPNYGDTSLFAQSEGGSYSGPQTGAGNVYSPYTETPSPSFGAGTGMCPYAASYSSSFSQANRHSHIDELLLPEEDNSLGPAWSASAIPGAASSAFTVFREGAESSARFMSRGENDGRHFLKCTDETDSYHSSSPRLRTENSTLNYFSQVPFGESPLPLSDTFQVASRNDLYHQNKYQSNNETVSSYDTQEDFSKHSSFLGGVSELSLHSVPFEQVSDDSGSDGGQQIHRSRQKPRQRLTKEEYDRMTREQLEARRRDNMRECSKEYRARKKQEQDRNARNYQEQIKLNEELNQTKHALEKQKHIMQTSLEQMRNKFR